MAKCMPNGCGGPIGAGGPAEGELCVPVRVRVCFGVLSLAAQ